LIEVDNLHAAVAHQRSRRLHAERELGVTSAMLGGVPDTADPGPIISERLAALAAESAPKLASLDAAIAGAEAGTKRSLRAERRAVKREFRKEQREVRKLRGPGAAW
jgi:hypothetical protein